MVVGNFDIMRIASRKPEYQSPRAVDRHRPLALPVSAQRMQSDRFQRRNVIKRLRGVQDLQPGEGLAYIHAAELGFAFDGKALGRAVGETCDHLKGIAWSA